MVFLDIIKIDYSPSKCGIVPARVKVPALHGLFIFTPGSVKSCSVSVPAYAVACSSFLSCLSISAIIRGKRTPFSFRLYQQFRKIAPAQRPHNDRTFERSGAGRSGVDPERQRASINTRLRSNHSESQALPVPLP